MKRFKYNLALRIAKAFNAVIITLPFVFGWFFYYADHVTSPYYAKGNWLVIVLFCVVYIAFGRTYNAFQISISRIAEIVYAQALAAAMSNAILYMVTWLLSKHLPNVVPLLLVFVAQVGLSALWAKVTHKWHNATFPAKKCVVIYDDREGIEQLIDKYGLGKKFSVQETISVQKCMDNIEVLNGLDTVFLSGIHSHDRNIILKHCIASVIEVYVIPRIGDVLMSGAKPMHLFYLPMLRVERYNPNPEYLFIKRALDVLLSLIAIIVASPFMLVAALAIKLTDGGPVLYHQTRLTKDGKCFEMLKFRSMRVDAEEDGVARLSTGDQDERVTPIGRLIRKTRIDELPQILCILKGEMSLVGPRPERPEIAAQYCEEIPEFSLRLQAKAGLTGYAQIYGKYNTTPYDKLQMDLMYIANPSIVEDLKIVFATVKILFVPESTEGVGTTSVMEENAVGDAQTDREEAKEVAAK